MGLDVELEHGKRNPNTNVTQDDEVLTGKIALAHLNEFPDYYTRLQKMETEAEYIFEFVSICFMLVIWLPRYFLTTYFLIMQL